jgi:imidazolonepropionase-like amidohydrolase
VEGTTFDGTGQFLIPGLWDMHVHLGSYEEAAKALPRLIGYGITGVRDMASPIDDILRLRRATADRILLGPEIVAAGPILQRPLPFTLPPLVRTIADDAAARTVSELRDKGVDFVKVGDTLTKAAYLAVAAESRRVGLPFAGHLPVSISALEAARAGQRSIEHFGSAGFRGVLLGCSRDEAALTAEVREALDQALAGGAPPESRLYDAEFMARLADSYDGRKAAALFRTFARSGTWQVPTLSAIRGVWDEQRDTLSPAAASAGDRVWTRTQQMLREMRRADVKFLAGSDAPIGNGVPPLHDELVALVGAGMSASEALQIATRGPAEFLKRLDVDGTIRVGKRTDAVVVGANPLADIRNTRRVTAVVVDGRLISGAELQKIQ